MRKPLVIGMGPNVDYPTCGWHPAASATRVMSWATLGKWDALYELRDKIDFANLNVEYSVDNQGRDIVDVDQAEDALDRMLFANILNDNRIVILLGQQVTKTVGAFLGDLPWPPQSDLPLEPITLDNEKNRFSYLFRAVPTWHPSGICRRSAVERDVRAQWLRDVMHEATGTKSDGSTITDFRPPPTIVDGSYTLQELQALELEFFGGKKVNWRELLSSENFFKELKHEEIELINAGSESNSNRKWSDNENDASFDEVASGVEEYFQNNDSGWPEKD